MDVPVDGFLVTVEEFIDGESFTVYEFDWVNGVFDGFFWTSARWCFPDYAWDPDSTYRIWVQSYNGLGLSDYSPPLDF